MDVNSILSFVVTEKKTIAIVGAFVLLSILMIAMGISFKRSDPLKPKGRFLMFSEWLMEYFLNFTKDIVGAKEERKFTPLTICIFTSIFLTNIAGLFLLEEGAFANPIYPFVWSIGMFLVWNSYAIIKIGPVKFIKDIFTPVLLAPIEIIGLLTKPMSMGLRLIGNISAGSAIMMLFWSVPAVLFNAIGNIPELGNPFFATTIGAICGVLLSVVGAALSGYFSLFGPFIQATVFTTLTLASFQETISKKEDEE